MPAFLCSCMESSWNIYLHVVLREGLHVLILLLQAAHFPINSVVSSSPQAIEPFVVVKSSWTRPGCSPHLRRTRILAALDDRGNDRFYAGTLFVRDPQTNGCE